MKHKRNHIIILLVVVALIVGAFFFIYPPGKKTRLGLDLQGGLEVVYKATKPDGSQVSSTELAQAIAIMDKRVNGLGVTEAQVQKQAADQISVALPGVTDTKHALDIIGKTAQLEFYIDNTQRVAGPASTLADAVSQAQSQTKFKISAADLKALGDTKATQPTGFAAVTAPPNTFGNTTAQYFIYQRPPKMTGSAIKDARQSFENGNQPDVSIDFTSAGGDLFATITRQLADTGSLLQQNQTFAIVLDNVMRSDPYVDYKQNPQGITGGSAIISGGNMTIKDAQDLALVLRTGALPVTLDPIYQQTVSATLGKDSLRAGLIAALVGFAIVLIYMIFYYRFLGLIADLALLVYGVLLWGVFNAVPVTLSLPGIAGMILTIGVAADANVVIFERIKEEVRHGKTVRSAISSGYARGFKTILDANVLTMLTALVLFVFATAQPKGFALTLILGVLVSMFTAIAATRALLGLLADYEFFNKASFMGVSATQLAAAAERQAAEERASSGSARGANRQRRSVMPASGGDGHEVSAEEEPAVAAPAARRQPQTRSSSRSSAARKKKKRR
jgi:preprotein translocase subunit SecD